MATKIADVTLESLIVGETMSRASAAAFMESLIAEEPAPEVVAGALIALRMRGETRDELLGFLDTLFAHAITVPFAGDTLLDTCGTGGDGLGTFNISTASAIVLAACGVPVAKHGNRSVSSKSGSFDLLEAAGVPLTGDVDRLARMLERRGIAFLFAPQHHPALKSVSHVRRTLGVMTLFNMLGPLANPAPLTHQYVGVSRQGLMLPYGEIFAARGLPALIVHGREGADEALPGGAYEALRVVDGVAGASTLEDPHDFGIGDYPLEAFAGGDANENARLLWELLEGRGRPALQAAIALNVGLALHFVGRTPSVEEGVRAARTCMATAEPARLLRAYIEEV